MSGPGIRLRPVVSWPARAEPGVGYRISVDLETEGPVDAWPYEREEYAVGCMLDGGAGFEVDSVGDTTLVVHRFGGTYGPVTFIAHALDEPEGELRLTLITQGGVPFRTIPLNVDRPVPVPVPARASGTGAPSPPGASTDTGPSPSPSPPRYSLVPYPPEPEDLGEARELPPGRLFTAVSHAIPFTGRDTELGRLREWLEGDGVRVMLLHGPGGQGKTRLAAEFARRCGLDGWQAVQAVRFGEEPDGAAREADAAPMTVVAPPPPDGTPAQYGLLLVVDYAETRRIDDLLEVIEDAGASASGRPVRILLLARPSGTWWHALANRLRAEGVETASMELGSLLGEGGDRRDGFLEAAEWFAGLYGRARDGFSRVASSPRLQSDSAFEQVLAVQMAALSMVLTGGIPRRPSLRVGVAFVLLREERGFWSRELGKSADTTTSPDDLARAVHVASLVGPLSEEKAADLLRELSVPEPATVLRDHARCYPPALPGTALQPVSPDRLAEDYLAVTLQLEPWAEETTRRLVAGPYGAAAIGVLVETARRWPDVAGLLNAVLRDDPGAAVEAGAAVLVRLVEMPDADPAVLELIEERLSRESRIDLDVARAVLAERLFGARFAAAAADPVRQADLYQTLGRRRAAVGMYEKAEAAVEAAVALRRTLSVERDDALTANDLAAALHASANNLGRMGRHEESLQQAREGVAVLRDLAAVRSREYRPHLASALNSLALVLAELGRRRESLAAVEESVAIYRNPEGEWSDAHRLDFASALNNLSARLAGLGRPEEALTAVEEAVAIHRDLERDHPGAHLPALAAGLHNRSLRLAELGRTDESIAAAEEAVGIQRRLAATVPDAYEPSLAGALANLSARLGELGRPEDAMAVNLEAVDVYRALAGQRPDAYRPDLAAALNNLSARLGELGRPEEALAVNLEAVDVYRVLVGRRPGTYRPDLAAALNNLSVRLGELGRPDEGLAAIREAIAIRRSLVRDDPAAFECDLAASLVNLAERLDELGRHEESISAIREAVAAYERPAARRPAAHRPALAASLDHLAAYLGRAGRPEEALEVSHRAVELYRDVAALRPSRREDLARALSNASSFLMLLDRAEESAASCAEAVRVYRDLVAEGFLLHRDSLRRSLVRSSRLMLLNGRTAEAAALAEEAVELVRSMGTTAVPAASELAEALSILAFSLWADGRADEAVTAATEAAAVHRDLAGPQPRDVTERLQILMLLSDLLGAQGRTGDAVDRLGEAVDLRLSTLPERSSFRSMQMLGERVQRLASRLEGEGGSGTADPADDAVREVRALRDRLAGTYRGARDEGGS
ncbi:tetratricopeptide repeat protein [Actinomadura sp. WMMB 499]|uniref:tetratricopeptide repeat protein n=1 Tax=Actinomadura sp. WMMB 499 TaxID=1219491 RepID=UPI001244F680|nr:tetratricopeptide repeat protein [Actinomadura sp. WMMB 499]QFG22995.1 tetratricopeptide repeat protein [Actinomadura sp. WMMB 499]